MFYDKLNSLCKKKGTSVTAIIKELKLSTSSGTRWKNGQKPNAQTAKLLADRLEVSVDYLLADVDDIRNRPLSDNEAALLAVYEKLDDGLQKKILGRIEMLALTDYGDTLNLLQKLRCSGLSEDEIDKILDQHIGNRQGGQGI